MQHIEEAGVHSGDSTSVLPPHSLAAARCSRRSSEPTRALALELGVVGLMNVQFAVQGERGLRPRGEPARVAHGAVRIQGDRRAAREDRGQGDGRQDARRARRRPTRSCRTHVAVKESVFPFAKFPGVDTILGPEMRSTGEVMGIAQSFAEAFGKAHARERHRACPSSGTRVHQRARRGQAGAARRAAAARLGFTIVATGGTARALDARRRAVPSASTRCARARPHVRRHARKRRRSSS